MTGSIHFQDQIKVLIIGKVIFFQILKAISSMHVNLLHIQNSPIQNSPIQNSPIQNGPKNQEMKEKKQSNTKQSGLRSPVGALRARRRLAAITGSKFRIQSCPLLASSQHVGATAAVTNLFFLFVEQRTILGLAAC